MKEFMSNSVEMTELIGAKFANTFLGKEVIALHGELGAGKTAFVRGVAKGLKISDDVSSPTFSIVHEYEASAFPVYHFDMYRVNSCDDLYSTGYFDYIYTGVLLIEWSENIIEWLPKDVINVYIRKEGEETRKIIFEGNDKFEGVGN